MENYINKVTQGDCRNHLDNMDKESIHLFLSDIPYGINLDDWDVLHDNTNSALLGKSPAQEGKSGFKSRGKPINGWNKADRNRGSEYEKWVSSWSKQLFPSMKKGAPLFVFGARRTIHHVINAFEDSGFLLKDVLSWKKESAHHRAQRITNVLERRGMEEEAEEWSGWRLGNLAPIYEPIAWFFKPYDHTVTDNVLEHGVGAMNIEACKVNGSSPTNMLEFGFAQNEEKIHEAQKPLELMEYLIKLTSRQNYVVLDPFIGSGTTGLAAKKLNRKFIGIESNKEYCKKATDRIENY